MIMQSEDRINVFIDQKKKKRKKPLSNRSNGGNTQKSFQSAGNGVKRVATVRQHFQSGKVRTFPTTITGIETVTGEEVSSFRSMNNKKHR